MLAGVFHCAGSGALLSLGAPPLESEESQHGPASTSTSTSTHIHPSIAVTVAVAVAVVAGQPCIYLGVHDTACPPSAARMMPPSSSIKQQHSPPTLTSFRDRELRFLPKSLCSLLAFEHIAPKPDQLSSARPSLAQPCHSLLPQDLRHLSSCALASRCTASDLLYLL